MIQLIDDRGLHDFVDFVEIDHHALTRSVALNRSVDCDLETIRVSVQPRALSGMMWENVRGFEVKRFADLHQV